MAVFLGQLVRPLGEVRSRLLSIRQDLSALIIEAQGLARSLDSLSGDRFSNAALLRRAASGRDPIETTLSPAVEALEKRKAGIEKDVELWLDMSFDESTTSAMRTKFFPRQHLVLLGGGIDWEVRALVSDIEHLIDEAADADRRLDYFGGLAGESPVKDVPAVRPSDAMERVRGDHVFVAYSHANTKWLERLRIHLAPIARDKTFHLWDDTRIRPGERWREEIKTALDSASLAILLVSPEFLASEFIATNELPAVLTAESARGLKVVPVFVAPCRIPPELSVFQGLNSPARTLDESEPAEADRVLVKLVDLICDRNERK